MFGWLNKQDTKPKFVIRAPKLGFLNLLGSDAERSLLEDKEAFGSIFRVIEERNEMPLQCDVLVLYCRITEDGRIEGTNEGLQGIIRNSGARVALVATENSVEGYIAAGKNTSFGANLVMTLQRNGSCFGSFFKRLFTDMSRGIPMPVAWEKMAPQIPGKKHENVPETIFSIEAGQVAFR